MALEKIVAAVGQKYTGKLDRDRLVFDLQDAWSKWLLFTALDSDKGARARRKLFAAVADSAINFKKRLAGTADNMYAAASLFLDGSRFNTFVAELDRVISAATELMDQNSRGGWVRLRRSPKEWMVAEVLPEVFRRNFHRLAKTSRNPTTGKVNGPYIRFAAAVMVEWGIPIRRGVIARALKDVRAGRERRKKRSTTLARPKGW